MSRTRLLSILRLGLFLLLPGLAVASIFYLNLNLTALLQPRALSQMTDYAGGFLRPDLSQAHLGRLWQATLETLAMSLTSTVVAAVAGLTLAIPAAGRGSRTARIAARLALNGLRSIPELVWAALLVLGAGLGPNAGTLALALHTTGVLGRLFAEALENTPETPMRALTLAGSGRFLAFCYGTLPLAWPQLVAYALYRWENNIRMAAVMGFVGAGGLGQMLYIHLSLFQEPQAASVILAMLLAVMMVDGLSSLIRGRWVVP